MPTFHPFCPWKGGARSLSVFDNVIGSGSISPLIVTGGRGGDVGLHDFRYIATGRTTRRRHADKGDQGINSSSMANSHTGLANKIGDQNSNGMLWYIPKAHLGMIMLFLSMITLFPLYDYNVVANIFLIMLVYSFECRECYQNSYHPKYQFLLNGKQRWGC